MILSGRDRCLELVRNCTFDASETHVTSSPRVATYSADDYDHALRRGRRMTLGRAGLCFLLICVGCGGVPLVPVTRMWVATQAQRKYLQVVKTECIKKA